MPDEAGRARPQDEVISEVIYSLLDKLEEADRLYGKGEDTQREGVIDALLAFMEFQSLVSDQPSHQRPINAVINALRSLDKGKVLPLLEPRRRSGRPCDSVGKEGCKGIVAHVVKRLVAMGLNVNEAYEKVAGVCRKAGITPGRKGARDQRTEMTGRTVRGWCAGIDADVGRNRLPALQFDLMTACSPAGNTKLEDVDALLEKLQRFLVETGASWH